MEDTNITLWSQDAATTGLRPPPVRSQTRSPAGLSTALREYESLCYQPDLASVFQYCGWYVLD